MKYGFIFLAIGLLISCNWAKQKAKDTVNKSGEIVAETGSEFANGISKGVEKTFKNEIMISSELKNEGLKTGKIIITGSDTTTDNILTAYLIFDKDIDKNITVKVFDEQNREYGRTTNPVKGQSGEAKYIDFVFDPRTNIDGKGMVTFE